MENVSYIDNLVKRYFETFKELPVMPKMVSYKVIADLMEDAIVSKTPVNPADIAEVVSEISEPIDLSE